MAPWASTRHAEAEKAWAEAGVLSSEEKKVLGADLTLELGASFDGDDNGWELAPTDFAG